MPVLNIGGYIPDFPLDTPPDEFQMMFGTRCFFGWTAAPDGSAGWFANPPHPREPAPGELEAMTDADWRTWLLELLGDDHGPMREMIAAAPGPLTGWATYDMPRRPALVPGQHDHHRGRGARDLARGGAGRGDGAGGRGGAGPVPARRARTTAFATFEGLRRERVERVVKAGARSSNAKAAGPVGPGDPRRAAADHLPAGGEVADSSLTWMHGHHIEWSTAVR